MLPSFASEQITLVRPTWARDARNVNRPDYGAAATRVPVPGCVVQPGATVEDLAGRSTVTVRWTVQAPPGIDVEASDAVEYRGRLYAIDGEPARWESPTGAASHVVLLLIDFKG